MPLFEVLCIKPYAASILVMADSEEEARKQVDEGPESFDMDWHPADNFDIIEIEEFVE